MRSMADAGFLRGLRTDVTTLSSRRRVLGAGIDPVSWSPHSWGRRIPRWRNDVSRGLPPAIGGTGPAGARSSPWPRSFNPGRRPFATGSRRRRPDRGVRADGRTTGEREDMIRLRRENRQLEARTRHPGKSRGLVREGDRHDPQRVYGFVRDHQTGFPVAAMCRVLRVSPVASMPGGSARPRCAQQDALILQILAAASPAGRAHYPTRAGRAGGRGSRAAKLHRGDPEELGVRGISPTSRPGAASSTWPSCWMREVAGVVGWLWPRTSRPIWSSPRSTWRSRSGDHTR